MAIKDSNKKHYFAPLEDEDILKEGHYAAENNGAVKIWQQGKSDDKVEEYEVQSFDEENKRLWMKSKGGLLSKFSTSKNVGNYIFLRLGEGKFLHFTTGFLRYDEEKKLYYFDIKNEVFKSQQRSNYRLNASHNISIQVKIGEEILDCGDISAGGTSFIVPDSRIDDFPKDKVFEEVDLLFNRKKFAIPEAKVAGTWEQYDTEDKPNGEIKVGLQFMGLSDKVEEDLFTRINSEARGEVMRKKILEQAAAKAKK